MCILVLWSCVAPPVSPTENTNRVDGRIWASFTTEYKLALIKSTQEEVRKAGLTTKYPSKFYLVALNEFYSHRENLAISLGDAMSMIGFPSGDFERGE